MRCGEQYSYCRHDGECCKNYQTEPEIMNDNILVPGTSLVGDGSSAHL